MAAECPAPSPPPSVPFPRLEPLLQKFVKVAIPTDAQRLDKHRLNVERLCRQCEWDRLHQEQVNARRTVQVRTPRRCRRPRSIHRWWKGASTIPGVWSPLPRRPDVLEEQLLMNVREVEKLRELVVPGDGLVFERTVRPARREAGLTVTLLLALGGGGAPGSRGAGSGAEGGQQLPSAGDRMFTSCPSPGEFAGYAERRRFSSSAAAEELGPQSLPVEFKENPVSKFEAGPREEGDAPRLPLPERPRGHAASESWTTLRLDLEELLELLHDKQVRLPSGILRRRAGGGGGTEGTGRPGRSGEGDSVRDLAMVAAWPMAGALIGGVVAGPLGFLTGLKVAAIAAAISGSLIGFTGGTIIQKWKERRRERRQEREKRD
uniref:Syntaxin-17 isoform X1 n=1 Tax=Petromyzon marinus TaxID=7757 RepID=A0AAJ7U9Y2_PETMA|nr:syntaxin-17 isoform X1 [Petromyzon marinus]